MKKTLLVSPHQELLRILFELLCAERDRAEPRYSMSALHEKPITAVRFLEKRPAGFDIVFLDTYEPDGRQFEQTDCSVADAILRLASIKRFVVYAPKGGDVQRRYEQAPKAGDRAVFLSRPQKIYTISTAINEAAASLIGAEL